jgi:hypothetical protein
MNDAAKAAAMQVLLAQTWERHADRHPGAIVRNEFYADAIREYRKVPSQWRAQYGIEGAVRAVRAKLEQAGREAIGEMQTIEGPTLDLSGCATAAVEYVTRDDPIEAMVAFCQLDRPPNRQEYLRQARERVNRSVVGRIIGCKTLAEDGRTIARSPSAVGGQEPEQELEIQAIQAFVEDASMVAQGAIRPALEQIGAQHLWRLEGFRALARGSGIVPAERADIVGQGLYAGYCHDGVVAMHLLVPQFEHLVRMALKQAGALTTTHDKDGLDMEVGLSSLVELPQMAEVFGEDLTFAIRALMCEQTGPNLRNAVAHGLGDDSLYRSPPAIYAWWLILGMVVQKYLVRRIGMEPGAADVAEAPEAEAP